MTFNAQQVRQMLQPVNPVRVMQDGKGHAHLPAHDVIAHLIRIFGFGNFDYEILETHLLFEKPRLPDKTGASDRWDVAYRAAMRLTVNDPEGNEVCRYEDVSTGDAANQKLADAHDLALKSAVSLAKKRCAMHLGDQWGASLYNKGMTTALVRGTLVVPEGIDNSGNVIDVQADLPKPESLGHDEIEKDVPNEEEAAARVASALGGTEIEPHHTEVES